jgi:hypothetical protein
VRYLADSGNTSMFFSAVMDNDLRVLRTETIREEDSNFTGLTQKKR